MDLIDRQAAIEDAHKQLWYRMNPSMKERIDGWLKNLPSAQPEAPCYLGSPCEHQNPNAEIQEERTDKHTESHACVLISRQDAIDALDCINGVEEVLRSLPSAQPERKKGHWVDNDEAYECSVCGSLFYIEDGTGDMNFCPNCGADMRGKEG